MPTNLINFKSIAVKVMVHGLHAALTDAYVCKAVQMGYSNIFWNHTNGKVFNTSGTFIMFPMLLFWRIFIRITAHLSEFIPFIVTVVYTYNISQTTAQVLLECLKPKVDIPLFATTVKGIRYPDWLVSSQRLVMFESVTVKVNLTILLWLINANPLPGQKSWPLLSLFCLYVSDVLWWCIAHESSSPPAQEIWVATKFCRVHVIPFCAGGWWQYDGQQSWLG